MSAYPGSRFIIQLDGKYRASGGLILSHLEVLWTLENRTAEHTVRTILFEKDALFAPSTSHNPQVTE
jgi:hypothetical protein